MKNRAYDMSDDAYLKTMPSFLVAAAYPKSPRYENRKLLDLAHRVEYCVNCGAKPEGGCIPCHSNQIIHGNGIGRKAHDDMHFAGCSRCHDWYDGKDNSEMDPSGEWWGKKGHPKDGEFFRNQRNEFFAEMHQRTFRIYFDNNWLKVAA